MPVWNSFWDGKLNSEMLKMKCCKDATAEGPTKALLSNLLSQMAGFSVDTYLFGKHNLVSQRLRAQISNLPTFRRSAH
jgi:hypothetical protein